MNRRLSEALALIRQIRTSTKVKMEAAIAAAAIQYEIPPGQLEDEWRRYCSEHILRDGLSGRGRQKAEVYLFGVQEMWEIIQAGARVKEAACHPRVIASMGSCRTALRVWTLVKGLKKEKWPDAIAGHFVAVLDRKDHQWRFGPVATAAMKKKVAEGCRKPRTLYETAKAVEGIEGETTAPSRRWFERRIMEVIDAL